MGRRPRKPLKLLPSVIHIDGADPVPLDSLSPEELAECKRKMNLRLNTVLLELFNTNPELIDQFLEDD